MFSMLLNFIENLSVLRGWILDVDFVVEIVYLMCN